MLDPAPQLTTPAAARPVAPGTTLGRYVVLDRVGQGGMGVVYAAYDPELDRRVALKLLHPGLEGSAGRAQLAREAQAMARLTHPNVVTVHDVDTVGDCVFVAMEFVPGRTLKAWIGERPRPWREVLATLVPAGRGLAAAHAAGLVHRDFKPDNVMLADDGRVLVMDFGLARHSDAPARPASETASETTGPASDAPAPTPRPPRGLPTLTGAILGTPAYMAPEQHMGRVADAMADHFAFCVSLHEALHGARPFAPEDDGTTRVPDALAMGAEIVAGRVRPGARDAELPARLRRAVIRGLASDPAARWPSMAALLDELDAIARPRRRGLVLAGAALVLTGAALAMTLSGGGAPAAGPAPCSGAAARLAGVWDAAAHARVRAAFTATGSPIAAASLDAVTRRLDGYTAAWTHQRTEACQATRRGEQSAEVLDLRMGCLDERLAETRALVQLFADADAKLVTRSATATSALSPLETCADVAALTAPVRPPADPAARAAVDATRAELAGVRAQRSAGLWPQALPAARAVVERAERLGHAPLVAEALHEQGNLEAKTGALAAAEVTFERCATFAERGHHDLYRAKAYLQLVYVAGVLGRRGADGHRHARLAEAVIARLGDPPGLRADLLEQEGNVFLYAERDAARALPLLEQAVTLHERALGEGDVDVGTALLNLGNACVEQRQYARARAHFERAHATFERATGAGHPLVALALLGLGNVATEEGRLEDAQGYYEQALALRERLFGADSPELGGLLNNLGEVMLKRARWTEALALERRALVLMETKFGAGNPVLGHPLTGLGLALVETGAAADAIVPLERALALRAGTGGTADERAQTSFTLARALWAARRDRRRARTLATQASAGWREAGDDEAVARAEAWLAIRGR